MFEAPSNCSVVPDSVQTDAGVAGAGVSYLCRVRGDPTDICIDLALVHHHQLHLLVPQRYHHPSWSAQVHLCASMPQVAAVILRSTDHHWHWHPVYRSREDEVHGVIPFLHHMAAFAALYSNQPRDSPRAGERLQA